MLCYHTLSVIFFAISCTLYQVNNKFYLAIPIPIPFPRIIPMWFRRQYRLLKYASGKLSPVFRPETLPTNCYCRLLCSPGLAVRQCRANCPDLCRILGNNDNAAEADYGGIVPPKFFLNQVRNEGGGGCFVT